MVCEFWDCGVEDEFRELAREREHVGRQRVDELARGVFGEADVLRLGFADGPVERVVFADALQLDDAAEVAEGFADLFGALFVGHVHGAEVLRKPDVVGDEDDERLRVGAAEVVVDCGELVLLLAAAVESLEVADEEKLEGRHKRRRLREIERFEDGCVGEVEVVETEVAEVRRDECVEQAAPRASQKEGVVAEEDVAGARAVAGRFSEKAVD